MQVVVAIITGFVCLATVAMAAATFWVALTSRDAVEASTKQAQAALNLFAAPRVGKIDQQAILIEDLLAEARLYFEIFEVDNRPDDTVLRKNIDRLWQQARELFKEATYEESRSAHALVRRFYYAIKRGDSQDAVEAVIKLEEFPGKLEALRDDLQKWIDKPGKD